METVKKIRVGLVGCGDVANQVYVPNLIASPFVDVVCVCDVVQGHARTTADRFGISAWFTDVNDMLDRADFALLVNTTPACCHAPISLAGLHSGRHVYSEKPIATSLVQAAALIEAARRHGVCLRVGPNVVRSPAFRGFHEAIHSREIGLVHAAYG